MIRIPARVRAALSASTDPQSAPAAIAAFATCFGEACQRERHRRSCARLRADDRKRDRADLLNRRILTLPDSPATAVDPKVPDPAPRDAMRLGTPVRIRQLIRVLGSGKRDAMPVRDGGVRREPEKVPRSARRDATDGGGPGP